MLVREVVDDIDADTMQDIIGSTAGGSRMGASEQAKADAKKIKPRDLDSYVDNEQGDLTTVDSYWVHRAMVAFRATRDITLQLNLTNLFDEAYYTRVRNNNVAAAPGRTSGWATPGDARSAQLTATWTF